MTKGKYFALVSRMHGKAMDVEGGNHDSGTPVIMYDYNGQDNQLWSYDGAMKCIRSKMDENLVLTLDGDHFCVKHFHEGDDNQKWSPQGDETIKRRSDGKVIDIAGRNEDNGATICAWDHNGQDNQQFERKYCPRVRCFIRSHLNDKVLDVAGESRDPGASVVMWPKKDGEPENQLWYEDHNGHIRSCLNDFAMDTSEGDLKLHPHHNKTWQKWGKSGHFIRNHEQPHKALDIKGKDESDGAAICAWDVHGNENQKWHFDYIE